MSTRKDFSQVALDVVRRATGEEPPKPEPKPQKETAPKAKTKGAAKKAKRPAKAR